MTTPEEQPSLDGCRVLLVEDMDLVAMQIEDMLVEGGATVAVAGSVAEALDAARAAGLAAAILDVHVRGGNTFGVADELGSQGVPVVFMSGDGERFLPERFAAAPHLSKPFEPENLLAVLAQALPASSSLRRST